MFFIWTNSVIASDVSHLRQLFLASYTNEQAAREFLNFFKKPNLSSPCIVGYHGVAKIMMCNHVINPFSKWTYFNEGRKMLECAIAEDPNNIELHFLRFAVQTNAPAFLNYKQDIAEDKKLMHCFLKSAPSCNDEEELRKIVIAYFANNYSSGT